MKRYYCHTKDTKINYLEITNDLTENFADKSAHKEIITPLDYVKSEKPC